jgi:Regulator of polyketide synthase expression
MFSCREIINLSSLAKLNIVAGKAGLDRLVRWVHFIDLPDVLPWVQGGELLIITGSGLHGDMARLKEIVNGIIKKNLAGLIINVGPYIAETPAEVIGLADQAEFPIFELPWEVRLIEVTREICSQIVLRQIEERSVKDFLGQLLLLPSPDPEMLIQRAAHYGYDLANPHQVALVRPTNLTNFLQTQTGETKQAPVALDVQIESIVREVLDKFGHTRLQMLWAGDSVLLLPCENKTSAAQRNAGVLAGVVKKLAAEVPGLEFVAALGGRFESVIEARKSYLQAIKVLQHAQEFQSVADSVYAYEQLGIFKLLFEMGSDKLRMYYREVIEPLNEYDKKRHMDLANSLLVYFEENCNAERTAKRLFIHRNTLDYRLKKIEEITGRSLGHPYDRLTLQMGVVVGKQIAGGFASCDL